jgi:hypothetical protein
MNAHRLPRIRSAIAAAAIAVALLAAPFAAPQQAFAGNVPTKTDSTFELVPDSGLIHVTVTLTMTNSIASVTESCPGYASCTTDYYITEGDIAVDPTGVNFRATTDGGASVSVKSGGEGFLSDATVTYPPTYFGATRVVTLTYDIPGGAPRSRTPTRAGKAYALFCGFPGGAYEGDPQSFRIVVPARYVVEETQGAMLTKSLQKGKTVLGSGESNAPKGGKWTGACVEARDDASFVTAKHSSASGIDVETEAWPEDAKWLAAVSSTVGATLDALEVAIGRPPKTDAITVREVLSATLGEYVGAFDSATSSARVGEDALDPVIATHELAHAWFNDSFSSEVWLDEGYAEATARTAARKALGVTGSVVPCAYPGPIVTDRVALADWAILPALPTDKDRQRVADQYDVACWIVTEVGRRIGADRLREIYAAAVDGEIAYVGANPPEITRKGPITWRDWLDLVDERGRVPAGEKDLDWLQDVLVQAGAANESALANRSATRRLYHDLLASTDPWAAPIAIRRPMAGWSWKRATEAVRTAHSIYAAHASSLDLVEGLSESDTVRTAYEAASSQEELEAALLLANTEHDAAEAVKAGVAAAAADRNPVEAVGLVGEDLDADADAAVQALVVADFDAATAKADAVVATGQDAAGAGGVRLGGAGVVVLVGAGGAFFLRRRRRARGDAGRPPTDATADMDGGPGSAYS